MPDTTRDSFAAKLTALKQRSSLSYQKLATELARPVSTLHGWITGRHLPYARQRVDFENLLRLLGVTDDGLDEWTAELAQLRTTPVGAEFDNPYRGLESFTESDSDLFYGRNDLTRQLMERLEDSFTIAKPRPLMVIGASGSGKTSLLRAGLIAELNKNPDYAAHYLTPGNDPVVALMEAARSPVTGGKQASREVVIVDQFEEIFGEANSSEAIRFTELLRDLGNRPHTELVIGLRADFFHRAANLPFLLDGLQNSQLLVGPMSTEETTDCIVFPARRSGLTIAPDLLTELITEFGRRQSDDGFTEALPLLSHVLYLMTDTSTDRHLTLDHYNQIGGLTSALHLSADSVVDSMGAGNEEACRYVFTRLVELGIDSLPTRRTVSIADLTESAGSLDVGAVIDEFAGHRLLTTNIDSVTISHEALLTAWPRLVDWINDERGTLMSVRRIEAAARAWNETGREADGLLRGSRLESADSMLEHSGATARFSEVERAFLSESRSAHQAHLAAKKRVLSRQLSGRAQDLKYIDPSLSAQVAVVANEVTATVESRSALLGATSPLPGARFLGGPGPTPLAMSADDKRVAFSNSVDGSISIADSVEGVWKRAGQLHIIPANTQCLALALSSDGQLLAAGGTDRMVTLVDLSNGETSVCSDGSSEVFDSSIQSLTFDPTGRQLYAGGPGAGIRRWNVSSTDKSPSATLDSILPGSGTTAAMCLDPTGMQFAAGNLDGTVALWDVSETPSLKWADTAAGEEAAAAVALSPDGHTLVAGYHSGRVRIWNIETRNVLVEIPLDSPPFASWVNWTEFTPDGTMMIAASSDGNVRVWDTRTWRDLRVDLQHPTVVICARCTHDGSLVTTAEDGTMRVWNLPPPASDSSESSIWSLNFDAAGGLLASSSRTRATIWSLNRRGKLVAEATFSPTDSNKFFSGASAFSPSGELLIVGTREGPVLLVRTDHPNEKPVALPGLTNLVENIAMSADGTMFCGVDHDGNVQIWTIGPDLEVTRAGSAKVSAPAMCPAFDQGSATLAVASETGDVSIFDVSDPDTPQLISAIGTGDSFALSVAFHPTMPLLAAANADRSVGLWDCANPERPEQVDRLEGPGGKVMTVAFNPAGDMLAAGVTDGQAWVWDTSIPDNAALHAVIQSREVGIYALTFSPDGTRLLAAGPRQRIFSWLLHESAAVAAIYASAGDPITLGEWSRFVPSLPYRRLM